MWFIFRGALSVTHMRGEKVMVAVVVASDVCVCVYVHRWGQAQLDGIGLKICNGLFSPLTLMLGN